MKTETPPSKKNIVLLQYKLFGRGDERPSNEQIFERDIICDVQSFIVDNYCEDCFVGKESTAAVQYCGRDNNCIIPALLEKLEKLDI